MGTSSDDERTAVDQPVVEPTVEPPPEELDAADRSELPTAIIEERALPSRPGIEFASVFRKDGAPPPSTPTPVPTTITITITTAAEAMRGEEIERTRTFIKLGWAASLVGLSTLPFVERKPMITLAFVSALALGFVVSFGYWIAFRDQRRYTPRALFVLGVMSVINTHVAILFFGVYTLTTVLIVLGLHFVGRSELSPRRAIYITALICNAVISIALISGFMPDPGVFATDRPLGVEAYIIGSLYTQAAYTLAYYTGKSQRLVSLRSIEQLQRATRVASQRAALLEELRADLARAQQGGAGRYTDQVFAGYRLAAVIGRGAHGEVYEAAASQSSEPAAVKLLHRELLTDPTQVARFLREARAMGSLASPNIVKVLAASEADAPVPFLVMERLRGTTLAELLRRKNHLKRDEVIALVTQIAAGIDVARTAGIVHRDLKPPNLFLDGQLWKILDFGVATLNEQHGTLTQGGIVGTPHYMAPEQARGGRVDYRADLYALGVIAYRALVGRNPFSGSDTPAILYAVVHTMPPRPSSLVELPPDVDRWFALALAKEPQARFDSGQHLGAQLAAAFASELLESDRIAADRLIERSPWQELA